MERWVLALLTTDRMLTKLDGVLRNLSNRNNSTKDLRLMGTLRQLRRSPVQVTRLAIDSETRWRRRLSMILTPVLMTPSIINVLSAGPILV
jgi:hypothetical protein